MVKAAGLKHGAAASIRSLRLTTSVGCFVLKVALLQRIPIKFIE